MALSLSEKYEAEFIELSKYENAIFTDYLDTGMSIEQLAEDYEVPAGAMRAFLIWHDRIKSYDMRRVLNDGNRS